MKTITFTIKTKPHPYPDSFMDSPVYRYMLISDFGILMAQGESLSSTFSIGNIPENASYIIRVERNGVIISFRFLVTPESKSFTLS